MVIQSIYCIQMYAVVDCSRSVKTIYTCLNASVTAELVLCSRDALSLTVAVVELKCAFTTVRAIAEAPAHPAPCTAKRAGMSFFEQNLVV